MFFTADYHLGHNNIIKYCDRPFSSVEEMDETIIDNHNSVVGKDDIVVHAGDLCLYKSYDRVKRNYIDRLNGQLIFLMGSHDKWLSKCENIRDIWKGEVGGAYIVICHYLMRIWPLSHYGSWHLYGHSHGRAVPLEEGKQLDVGVDCHNFYPLSFDDIVDLMQYKEENPNLISKRFKK
ncbi:MAG: metallophosphatase [Bacteroidales bacterium]